MKSRVSRNLSIVLRAQRLMARRRMAAVGRQVALVGAAALILLMGLVMLDVALFLYLMERMAPYLAALSVGLADLVLAVLLVLMARAASGEGDLKEVAEVRDMAMADLEAELADAGEDVRGLLRSARQFLSDPVVAIGSTVVGALLALALRAFRK